ncbi:MAG: adenylate/guanylate cyclase domain-containing protein [Thermodesulfobacteriota bacterium]
MTLKDFFEEIDEMVSTVNSPGFDIEIVETKNVPSFNDASITYDNLDTNTKSCKRLESCVLYVDMRDSTQISAVKRPKTLSKIYSSFVRSMISCAGYFGGYVRNIIGDRVMVVFDQEDCFKKSVDTAILMNSVGQYILNKRIKDVTFKCGIGIDFGTMLIAKAGTIKRGAEKEFYRSLVWLGNPANIASKLTDLAFKSESYSIPVVHQGNYYRYTDRWVWFDKTYEQFIDDLEVTHTRMLKHKDDNFCSFFKSSKGSYNSYKPILISESVYNGFKKACPEDESIKNSWWHKKSFNLKGFSENLFGGDIYFKAVKEL